MSEAERNECTSPPICSVGVWKRTWAELPCPVGEQVDVLMWSPHWATWIHGMFTHFPAGDGGTPEWACYDANNDKFYDWPEPPEWWAAVHTPNAQAQFRSEAT